MDVELPPDPYLKEDQLQDDEPPKAKRNGLVFDDEPITAGASEKLPDGPDELPQTLCSIRPKKWSERPSTKRWRCSRCWW